MEEGGAAGSWRTILCVSVLSADATRDSPRSSRGGHAGSDLPDLGARTVRQRPGRVAVALPSTRSDRDRHGPRGGPDDPARLLGVARPPYRLALGPPPARDARLG